MLGGRVLNATSEWFLTAVLVLPIIGILKLTSETFLTGKFKQLVQH